MAWLDAYVTPQLYRDARNLSDLSNDYTIRRQARAISRFLERKLDEVFNRVAAAETRLFIPKYTYQGYHPFVLDIDPVASLTGFAVKVDTDNDGDFTDETAVNAAYYSVLPLNASSYSEPWRQIEVNSWGSQGYWYSPYRVQVSALWGWPAVPDAIVEATIELIDIWRMNSPRSTGRVNELNQVVTTSRAAQNIVQELMAVYNKSPIGIA